MIYQFLRVALCVALLTGTTANAVGKRALWNFAEAKKELQKKLSELRKMDSTADVEKSTALADEIQGYINEVAKLDPTKASEFQDVLDASFEQEVGALSLEAQKLKQALTEQVNEKAQKIESNIKNVESLVRQDMDVELVDQQGRPTGAVISKSTPGLKEANKAGYLHYLSYVTVPIATMTFPFTKLITKSYKMSLRLLDFITRGSIGTIHNTYLGILQQEKDALEATIVNTSLAAALKINGFLNRVTMPVDSDRNDITAKLAPQEKRLFLGKIYDKVKNVATSLRTKDTFSGSQLHRIVMAELLEYNALLTPLVDFSKHPGLTAQLQNMSAHLNEFCYLFKDKKSFSEGEKNLVAALYEMHYTLESANAESKKILDPQTKQPIYQNGKLDNYFNFQENNRDFEKIFVAAGMDKAKMVDTRSYRQKAQDAALNKIGSYKEEYAALAGLVLTVAGGSYFVEQYLPQYKNKFTAYAAAPINYVITLLSGYFGTGLFGTSDGAKQKATAALAVIKSKIKQLPYSDRIAGAISYSWVKAVSIAAGGAQLMSSLYTQARGQAQDAFAAEDEQLKDKQGVYEGFYQGDVEAQKALAAGQQEFNLREFRQEQQHVESLSDATNDKMPDVGLIFSTQGNSDPNKMFEGQEPFVEENE